MKQQVQGYFRNKNTKQIFRDVLTSSSYWHCFSILLFDHKQAEANCSKGVV